MGYYSFVVFCDVEEVQLPEQGVILEHGPSAFNCAVDDVQEFLTKLSESGVRVVKYFDLCDTFDVEPVNDESLGVVNGSPILGENASSGSLGAQTAQSPSTFGRGLPRDPSKSSSDT